TGGKRFGDKCLSEDVRLLIEAAGTKDPYEMVNPICLYAPAAPSIASKEEGRPIELEGILRAFRMLKRSHQFLVVEGIGGLLVPINCNLFLADIAKKMSLPLIIVAKTSLGTINHTLLTIEAARKRRLKIAGIVLNSTNGPEDIKLLDSIKKELERLSGMHVLAVVPFIPEEDCIHPQQSLCTALKPLLNLFS
ncbi:MAG TPA: dethiobiotin synthase, partial [Candidatus Hypogeohydataceae bacterium YC41]